MARCCIIGCNSKSNRFLKTVRFHRFPKAKEKKNKWLNIIGTDNLKLDANQIFICSLHFEESCFNKTLDIIRLHDDALPTRFLGNPTVKEEFEENPISHPPDPLTLQHQPLISLLNVKVKDEEVEEDQIPLLLDPLALPHQPVIGLSNVEQGKISRTPDPFALLQERTNGLSKANKSRSTCTPEEAALYKQQMALVRKTAALKNMTKKNIEQKELIDRLQEKILQQSMEIEDYRKIIEELRYNRLQY